MRPAIPDVSDPAAEIIERTAAHGDEHVIKFADRFTDVYRRSGNPDECVTALVNSVPHR